MATFLWCVLYMIFVTYVLNLIADRREGTNELYSVSVTRNALQM